MKEHIYELRYFDQNSWHIFYVGRSKDLHARKIAHKSSAKCGAETLVYDFIRSLKTVNIVWDIFSVLEFNEYIQQEDDHILKLLFSGITGLQNMKKGDAKWREQTLNNIALAKSAGCNTIKDYKIWNAEQELIKNEIRHQKRIAEANEPEQSFHDKLVAKIKDSADFKGRHEANIKKEAIAKKQADKLLKDIKR